MAATALRASRFSRLRFITSVVASALALLTGVLACERWVTHDAEYPTYDAALRADAIGAHRWIPPYIPRSATQIRIRSNAESNETWLSFGASIEDLNLMVRNCKGVAPHDVRYPRQGPAGWWPQSLEPDARVRDAGHEYLSCRPNGFTALDRGRSVAFDWQFAQ
jgi:hypothetical protein